MEFDEILDQGMVLRQQLIYGALKRQFQLDDHYLTALATELMDGHRAAVDESGTMRGGISPAPHRHTRLRL